jgi:hypothetical protein
MRAAKIGKEQFFILIIIGLDILITEKIKG